MNIPESRKWLLAFSPVILLGVVSTFSLIETRHEYRKLRFAYEAALGAFAVSRVPVANAAELESLKQAIHNSKPTVQMFTDTVGYKADGTTQTVKGVAPVTDFGITRRSDGVWFAGSSAENKYKK